jgi:hypothetical protein
LRLLSFCCFWQPASRFLCAFSAVFGMSSGGASSSGAAAAGRGRAASLPPQGGGAAGAGRCASGSTGQPGSTGLGRGSAGRGRGRGHVEVIVGGRGRGSAACGGSAAASSSASGAAGSSPGGDSLDFDDDDDNNDDYEDAASGSGDNDDDDDDGDEEPGAANAPPENKKSCRARLLHGVVRSNKDYGLGDMVRLPDASSDAPAVFEDVELQAPTFFALRSVVRADGFSEEDPPICVRCLWWKLTAPFSRCNRDGGTRYGRCSYIQHARCQDVSLSGPTGPLPSCLLK